MVVKMNGFEFKVRRYVAQFAFDKSLLMGGENVKAEVIEDNAQQYLARALVVIVTEEEPIARIPADWWQAFKERWFRPWLLRFFPVQYIEIVAVHKYPELDVPERMLGAEFVNLEIMPVEKFEEDILGEG